MIRPSSASAAAAFLASAGRERADRLPCRSTTRPSCGRRHCTAGSARSAATIGDARRRRRPFPAQEALERAEQALLALSRHTAENRPQHIADIGAESYERYARLQAAEDKTALFGLTTGFRDLDQLLTGLPPGHLTIVAARPSTGKTAFALDIARHAAAKQGKNVAIFSLEMTKQELMDRIIAGYPRRRRVEAQEGRTVAERFRADGRALR